MTATKQFIGNVANHVNNSSTFEVWKDLTNDMATLIGTNSVVLEPNQNAATSSVGMANTGKLFLDGNIQLDTGRTLISDAIQATSGGQVTVNDDALIRGVLHLNRDDGSTNNPVEIQMQQSSGVNTWHLKTNTDHTQLRLGTTTRDIYFNADGTVTTSSDLALKFTFDNELLGPTIDGIAIGQTQHEPGKFTTLVSTNGITGDLKGSIVANGNQLVLENGTNGTNAWFKGVIQATAGSIVLNNGQSVGQATFVGDVTGNIFSETNAVKIVDTTKTTAIFTGNLSGNATTSSSCTGNSATATKFRTPVVVGGVAFDGTTEIQLAGVNLPGNQDTSGTAAKATQVGVTNTERGDLGNFGVVFALSHNDTAEGTSYQRTLYNDGGLSFAPSSNSLTVANGGTTTVDKLLTKGNHTAKGHITLDSTKQLRGDVAKTDGTTIVDVSAHRFYGTATSAITATSTTGNAGTATRLENDIKIAGVSFTGETDINLDGVNRPGTQSIRGSVLSADNGICLQNANTPINATFTGTSERARNILISTKSNNANYRVVFKEDLDDTTSYSGLAQDSAANFYYNPSTNTLRTGNFKGHILADDDTRLVDIANKTFAGNASTATHSSTSGVANSAKTCTGNSSSATSVMVSDLNMNASEGYSLIMADHNLNQNKREHLRATTAIQYQPSTNKTIFTGQVSAPRFLGTASTAIRWMQNRTINFTGNHVVGQVSFGAEGEASSKVKTVSLQIKNEAGFKVHANDIVGLDQYIDENFVHVDRIHPVGSIYITTEPGNPSTKFGATTQWSQYSKGRFLIGDGNSGQYLAPTFSVQTPQNHPGHPGSGQPTLAKQASQGYGGYYEHKLSINEMPNHRHSIDTGWQFSVQLYKSAVTNIREFRDGSASRHTTNYTNYTGGSQTHNNMPPFQVVYMWRRTQ
jgi:hypothetical protein